jgi:outer membrane protein assembly factor BamE (lipoprotein component of BamABCDE complex)
MVKAMLVGVLMAVVSVSQGCSVIMAASSNGDAASGMAAGLTRDEVQRKLGTPISSEPRPGGGHNDRYAYRRPDKSGPARATLHGVMDVLTIGFWEALATPLEAVAGADGPKSIAVIEYDADDRVVGWRIEEPAKSGGSLEQPGCPAAGTGGQPAAGR